MGLNIGRRLPHNLSVTPCPVLAGAGPVIAFSDDGRHVESEAAAPITESQVLRARRSEDAGDDLWTTFNRVLVGYAPAARGRTAGPAAGYAGRGRAGQMRPARCGCFGRGKRVVALHPFAPG
ncbi:hypothetical protein CEJ98_37220 (plasmid) [Burkholderia gladioli pv. gladioli]|nr:hypothetical protein CEJ98_37220 [Burkholderia gladioli pv. gladioli]AWY49867.1 hypothetical protein A8H28_01000 [Burkholderia gladioli pv. gladioli]